MTLAPGAAPLACATVEEAIAALRSRGVRLTGPRRLVLGALYGVEDPLPAEAIATRLGLDLVSVYRTLETLERHGLVQHVHFGHGPGRYALVVAREREYLFCERCGAVEALEAPELELLRAQIRRRFGYEARFTHFPLAGTCPRCRRQRSTPGADPPGRGAP